MNIEKVKAAVKTDLDELRKIDTRVSSNLKNTQHILALFRETISRLHTEVESQTGRLSAEFRQKEILWNQERMKLDQKLKQQKQEVDRLNAEVFTLSRKLEETESANRRVLLKSLEASKRFEDVTAKLAQAQKELSARDSYYNSTLDRTQKAYSDKTKQIIAQNTKRIVSLMGQVEGLKTEVERKNALLHEKERRERELVVDFVKRFRDMTSEKTQVEDLLKAEVLPKEMPKIVTKIVEVPAPKDKEVERHPAFHTETVESQPEPFADIFKGITAEMEEEETVLPPPPMDMSLIEPMIERAREAGDDDTAIIDSLVCSGYTRDDVIRALKKLG